MRKKQEFSFGKSWAGLATVGAVGALGLYGVHADFSSSLGVLQCVPRVDQERQAFENYLLEVNRIAEEETEFQVRGLREALRSFNPQTAQAVADFTRATGPGSESLSPRERAQLLTRSASAISHLQAEVALAAEYTDLTDFGFNTQDHRIPGADCPNGLGMKFFDEDSFFRCTSDLGGSPSSPNEIRRLRLRMGEGIADLTACTLRTEVMSSNYVVRTCSSVNLLNPWLGATAPAGEASGYVQSLRIVGDTAETALFHPEAIHQVDRDHFEGRVPYRLSESAWMHDQLAGVAQFSGSGRCAGLIEAPDYTLRGAVPSEYEVEDESEIKADDNIPAVVPSGDEVIDPWANEAATE